VILVDANLLIYAYDETSPRHAAARRWVEESFSTATVFLAWSTILAFVRITTSHRLFANPLSLDAVCAIVSVWLGRSNVRLAEPSERHWPILEAQLRQARAAGPLAMDAHLAALAVEHGLTLCSSDRDFRRFRGLKLENPLEE
jgi:toxin-antitoxin system PIN domain toxin